MAINLGQGIFCTLVGIVGLLTNALVIIVLLAVPSLSKTGSSKFIINQSIVDALASAAIALSHRNIVQNFGFHLSYMKDGDIQDEMLCRIWSTGMIHWTFMRVSTFNLVGLTLERYIKIVHPFFYRKHFSETKVKVVLVAPWILGFLYQIGVYYNFNDVKNGRCLTGQWPSKAVGMVLGVIQYLIAFLIPILMMLYSYTRMIIAIRKGWKSTHKCQTNSPRKRRNATSGMLKPDDTFTTNLSDVKVSTISNGICEETDATTLESENSRFNDGRKNGVKEKKQHAEESSREVKRSKKVTKLQKKVIKTLITVCVAYFLCFVWNQTTFFLANVKVLDFQDIVFSPFYTFSVGMMFVNTIVNPFIYAVQFVGFKNLAISVLCPCAKG